MDDSRIDRAFPKRPERDERISPAPTPDPAVPDAAVPDAALPDVAMVALPVGSVRGRPRRSRLRPTLFALLPIALIAGGYLYVTGGEVMSTENAYVQADMLGIATDVPGIVREIDVHDNQTVKSGDVLFKLDDLQFRLALVRSEAQLDTVRNDIAALKASYQDMQTQIQQAQSDIVFYNRELGRQQDLTSRQFAAQATLDGARRNSQQAQQKLSSLTQQLAAIAANLNGDPNIKPEDHPRYRDAAAQRDEAARQLAHTVVTAPMGGVVTNVSTLQPGQYLAASTIGFNVVATDHAWIAANPKETQLTYVVPGQKVDVTVDSYPGEVWKGTVESISPASSASFSLLPAQNTTGNWVKVVQRIPMRVRLETPAGRPPLRVGMSVTIDVNTGHTNGLPSFVTNLFGAPDNG
jgi:membrane fusion protein (multidrug efflux system)